MILNDHVLTRVVTYVTVLVIVWLVSVSDMFVFIGKVPYTYIYNVTDVLNFIVKK